jgi:hypothetical protein
MQVPKDGTQREGRGGCASKKTLSLRRNERDPVLSAITRSSVAHSLLPPHNSYIYYQGVKAENH